MTSFASEEILWKRTLSTEFQVIRPKPCGNCLFSQNLYNRRLGDITVYYAVVYENHKTKREYYE